MSNYPFGQPEKPSTPLSYSVANSQKQPAQLNPPREKQSKRPEELNLEAQELSKSPGDSKLSGNKITEHLDESNMPVEKRQKPSSELNLSIEKSNGIHPPLIPRVPKSATSPISFANEVEKPGGLIPKFDKILDVVQKERRRMKREKLYKQGPWVRAKYALLKKPPPSFPEAQGVVRLISPHGRPDSLVETVLFNFSFKVRLQFMLWHLDVLIEKKRLLNAENVRKAFEKWLFMEFFEPKNSLPVLGFTKMRVDGPIDENEHFQEIQRELIKIITFRKEDEEEVEKLSEDLVNRWFSNHGSSNGRFVEE
ncbi:hypothetical protein O181_019373 [Austropuccinia psidii MF-1]|uniref:Uncharacterized protein n=1 Tax=Austropuccinia psidii MF-1 TaxID=1389203 RepID=A0A9Q3C9J1_9BASI|nr:hypothetical protein [Austropuccinia psidii MF-1]